ncbi:hypothetical protein EJB05_00107, partial [Eragrostis curvula]
MVHRKGCPFGSTACLTDIELHTRQGSPTLSDLGVSMEAAVVSAAHGAMGSLLRKLGDLLTDKYRLLKGAKGQIMFLKAELEHMHAFLKKISDTDEPDEQDKCWAKEVRELSYDIEDSINEFMLHVECKSSSKPRGFMRFINRSMNLLTTMDTRHEVAKELECLKRRVMEVSERRMRYKVDGAVSKPNNTGIDLRLLALYAESADLVGIEGPRDDIIQLMDDKGVPASELKVLSIVGFGGLGKTTLANEIYRKLNRQFQCHAFVSVSQKPNIRKIFISILSQVDSLLAREHTMESWDDNEFISALRKFLFDKRYLIVIDDIWSDSAWRIIKCALPKNKNGSRLITTTRIETVAMACCTDHPEYVYKMKPLSDQDSRRLFFRRIFGSEVACPLYLKDVSAEILKKCGGMPLAIITISSLLASNPNKQKEQWDYVRNSLGSNLEVSSSLEGMRQILNLSYINLPHYLKTCMLYLGIYPEDCTIFRDDLIWQWVAEGFISKVERTDPEDVAKRYFNELINMSMIQPVDTEYTGEVMSCRIHDMILDLILHKSREENFITVTDDIQDMTKQHEKIRRLSLHLDGDIDDKTVGSMHLSQTRTLALFGTSSYLPPFILFKHLRVLTIEMSQMTTLPILDLTGIGHLFLLRHLKIIARNHLDVLLPNKLGGLQQLETFRMDIGRFTSGLPSTRELPSDIIHMSQLLHLIVPWGIRFPDGIGNMKSLRILRGFSLGSNSLDNIKALGELTNLTHLSVKCFPLPKNSLSGHEEAARWMNVLRTCIKKLRNLRHLCMDVSGLVPASLNHFQKFYGSLYLTVPEWIPELSALYDLSLRVREVCEDDFAMLAQLPSLTYLKLNIEGVPRDKIMIRGNVFSVLKHFRVFCRRLLCLTFEEGAMPKLERLILEFNAHEWDRYGTAPVGMEHLLDLKEVYVYIGGLRANVSNRRGAESALRRAIDMHPGRPTAKIVCRADGYLSFVDMSFDCGVSDNVRDESEDQKDAESCST